MRLGQVSCCSAHGYGKQLDPVQPSAPVGTCLPLSPSQSEAQTHGRWVLVCVLMSPAAQPGTPRPSPAPLTL